MRASLCPCEPRNEFALKVFREGGLLLHASAVAQDDKAYLFLGASGVGKTTVASLSPVAVIHDDLVVASPDARGNWWLERPPFPLQRSYDRDQLKPAQLMRAFRLVQASCTAIEALSPAQSLSLGLSSTPVIALDRSSIGLALLRWQRLCAIVPFFTLYFRRDESFWSVIRD